jgi:predicted nucleic acid-binding Zn ribbon protein
MAKELRSACCRAEVLVKGKTTHYYTCTECGDACDVTQEDTAKTTTKDRAIDAPPRDKMMRQPPVKKGKKRG